MKKITLVIIGTLILIVICVYFFVITPVRYSPKVLSVASSTQETTVRISTDSLDPEELITREIKPLLPEGWSIVKNYHVYGESYVFATATVASTKEYSQTFNTMVFFVVKTEDVYPQITGVLRVSEESDHTYKLISLNRVIFNTGSECTEGRWDMFLKGGVLEISCNQNFPSGNSEYTGKRFLIKDTSLFLAEESSSGAGSEIDCPDNSNDTFDTIYTNAYRYSVDYMTGKINSYQEGCNPDKETEKYLIRKPLQEFKNELK